MGAARDTRTQGMLRRAKTLKKICWQKKKDKEKLNIFLSFDRSLWQSSHEISKYLMGPIWFFHKSSVMSSCQSSKRYWAFLFHFLEGIVQVSKGFIKVQEGWDWYKNFFYNPKRDFCVKIFTKILLRNPGSIVWRNWWGWHKGPSLG